MRGIRAAKKILHKQLLAMGQKPLGVPEHFLEELRLARLIGFAPPNGVFADGIADGKFILGRPASACAGAAGEHAVRGKIAFSAAHRVLLQLRRFVIPTHRAARFQPVRIQPDGPVQIGGAQQRQGEIFFSECRSLHARELLRQKARRFKPKSGLPLRESDISLLKIEPLKPKLFSGVISFRAYTFGNHSTRKENDDAIHRRRSNPSTRISL